MKKIFYTRALPILLAMILLCGVMSANTLAAEEFVIQDDVLTEYHGDGGDVVIPDGVTRIEMGAFANCTALKSITIPDGVTKIGMGAFVNCTALKSITIPKSVVAIHAIAFKNCAGLTSVTFQGDEILIGDSAFSKCTSLTNIVLPKYTMICSYAFSDCIALVSVTCYDKIIEYPSTKDAFSGCPNLVIYGIAGSVTERYATNNSIPFVAVTAPEASTQAITATPTSSTVLVDGQPASFDAYTINGNNYFKLRDLACILSGSKAQFEVEWDSANNAIKLTSGQAYTAVGGEMASKGSGAKSATSTSSKLYLDGKEVSLTAYTINNNNYFKLRDIGQAFDFDVSWDGANNTIVIDTTTGYTAD